MKRKISDRVYELDEDSDLVSGLDTIMQIYHCPENNRQYGVHFTNYNVVSIRIISDDAEELLSDLEEGTVLKLVVPFSGSF